MTALLNSDLPELKLISKGKVRDIYATSSSDHLLFVATDRISAYDVIVKNVRLPSTPLWRKDLIIFFLDIGHPRQRQTTH